MRAIARRARAALQPATGSADLFLNAGKMRHIDGDTGINQKIRTKGKKSIKKGPAGPFFHFIYYLRFKRPSFLKKCL